MFVKAFVLAGKERMRFSPDDRVMDVYRALYPPEDFLADSLELEMLAARLEKRYGINLKALWRESITLGDLFEQKECVRAKLREGATVEALMKLVPMAGLEPARGFRPSRF